VSDWIPLFQDKPLAFEPARSSSISNGGYVLLGAIVEEGVGEDYYDYTASTSTNRRDEEH
jgi:CubicO group peptidase (beta-lactamase class C family)